MRYLIAHSIAKPIFAWMLLVSLCLFGYLNFRNLGIGQLPDVDMPSVSVSFEWEGASPEVIELDILSPMEGSLLAVEDLKNISSSAKRGEGNITLEFDATKDINLAVQEIQTILGRAQRLLPNGVKSPVIRKRNPEDRPILWISISSKTKSSQELMLLVRDQIKDRFLTVSGVSDVMLGGFSDPEVKVDVSLKKLRAFDLTISDLISTISREHAEFPAGVWKDAQSEATLRVLGEAKSPEEIGSLSVSTRGGAQNYEPIKLSKLANVELAMAEETRRARSDGDTSVGIGILKQRGVNTVEVGKAAKEKLEEIKRGLPADVDIVVRYDGTTFIEESVDELFFNLALSILLTSIVVYIFLGSLSSSLNIILSIPSAIMGALIIVNLLDFTLNYFTLLALTLAVGLVVDDNILVLENIQRLYRQGKDKILASLEGTVEIAPAALAASLAILAIFVPIGFMKGLMGQYLYQFAMTLSAAVVFSYLDAITLTPMRTSLGTGQVSAGKTKWVDLVMSRLEGFYAKTLNWALKYKFLVLLLAIISLGITFYLGKILPKEMSPSQDQGRLMISMRTANGSSLDFTDQKVREVEKVLADIPEIAGRFMTIGGWGPGESNSAFGFLTLVSKDKRDITHTEIMEKINPRLKEIKGVRAFIIDPSQGGLGGGRHGQYPIEYQLKGPELKVLYELSNSLKEKWEASSYLTQVDSSFKGELPEIHIIPDREAALKRGVSVEEMGQSIQALVQGTIVGKFSLGGNRSDIRVKLSEADLKNWEDLNNIFLRNNRGELIALSQVAKIEKSLGPQTINRDERQRVVTLTANLAPKVIQADAMEFIQKEFASNLPSGYSLTPTGNTLSFGESFQEFFQVIMLGFVIAFIVLAAQYNSLILPLVILSSLPFSFLGSFAFLKIFGQSLNMYSMIGLILLMGIVKKNAIILVDFTQQRRLEGLPLKEAILEACPTRLRPILMTALTTLAGTLPILLGVGPGSESRLPLGICIFGGLMASTVLTLYVVPCLYSLMPGRIDQNRANLLKEKGI